MADSRICSIDGCGNKVLALNYCSAHYQRFYRHGDPLAGGKPKKRGEVIRYFNEIVVPYSGDCCLIWPYNKNSAGYGMLKKGRTPTNASRLACEAVNGPPPSPKHQAAHSCGNGHLGCVNPRHLRWATVSENLMDRIEHGTHNRGEKNPSSRLTADDVQRIRSLKGKISERKIGEIFGVSQGTVNSIHRGRNWSWLP